MLTRTIQGGACLGIPLAIGQGEPKCRRKGGVQDLEEEVLSDYGS